MERKLFTKKLKYCGESRVQEEERSAIVQGRSVHVHNRSTRVYYTRSSFPDLSFFHKITHSTGIFTSHRASRISDCFHKNSTTPKDIKIERNLNISD